VLRFIWNYFPVADYYLTKFYTPITIVCYVINARRQTFIQILLRALVTIETLIIVAFYHLSVIGVHNTCYPRTDPTVIAAVLSPTKDQLLLGQNHRFPGMLYSCLAGFMEPGISSPVIQYLIEPCLHLKWFGSVSFSSVPCLGFTFESIFSFWFSIFLL